MSELISTQAFVVVHEILKIPRAVFIDREMAQEFVDGDQVQKSIIEPCLLLTKKGGQLDDYEKTIILRGEKLFYADLVDEILRNLDFGDTMKINYNRGKEWVEFKVIASGSNDPNISESEPAEGPNS
jgi:hypothetical protein